MRDRRDRVRAVAVVTGLCAVAVALVSTSLAAATPAGRATVASSSPDLIVRAGETGTVYVATGCQTPCTLGLWRADGAGATRVRVGMPPVDPAREILQSLVFATPAIGVAVVRASGTGTGPAVLYRTTDGGESWRPGSIGADRAVLAITSTASSFDLVTARCPAEVLVCTAVAFQRTAVDRWRLSSVALANQRGLGSFGTSVAAFGANVWISEATAGGAPLLATSTDAGASFLLQPERALVAVTTCDLTATSPLALWASCPTGMLVSVVRSTDAGATWSLVVDHHAIAGTDGHAFDPVEGDLAYLHLTYPGPSLLRVSGPAGWITRVGPGPFRTTPTLVFVNRLDGFALGEDASGTTSHLAATTDGGAHWRVLAIP